MLAVFRILLAMLAVPTYILLLPRYNTISSNSTTLTVASDIFVISLPRRTDRRASMLNLAQGMHLDFQFIEATDSSDSIIDRIMSRVRRQRQLASNSGSFNDAQTILNGQPGLFGSDTWLLNSSDPHSADASDPLPPDDLLDPDSDFPIPCAKGNPFRAKQSIPSKLTYSNTLSKAMIACWHSHLQVIRKIAYELPRDPSRVSIVFEDDVDFEWDIESRLLNLWHLLPLGWDIVMLGHCWSEELEYSPISSSPLHPSSSPLCTHAYALSQRGAEKLLDMLRHPAFAYSRALDQAIAWLIRRGHLDAYSIVPSLVIQTRETKSDIWTGRKGSKWEYSLLDSARTRLKANYRPRLRWADGWWRGQHY